MQRSQDTSLVARLALKRAEESREISRKTMNTLQSFVKDLAATSQRTQEASVQISKLVPSLRNYLQSRHRPEQSTDVSKQLGQPGKGFEGPKQAPRQEKAAAGEEPTQTPAVGTTRKNSKEDSTVSAAGRHKHSRAMNSSNGRNKQREFLLVKKRSAETGLIPARLFDRKHLRNSGCNPAVVPEHVKVQGQDFNDFYGVEPKPRPLLQTVGEESARCSVQYPEEEAVAQASQQTTGNSQPSNFPFPHEETNAQLQPADFSFFRRKLVKKRFSTNLAVFARDEYSPRAGLHQQPACLDRPESGASHQSMMVCEGAKQADGPTQLRRSSSMAGQYLSLSISKQAEAR